MEIQLMIDDLNCPKCNSPESHPTKDMLLVRGYKVDNWSECLVCGGWYDKDLNWLGYTRKNPPPGDRFWFGPNGETDK